MTIRELADDPVSYDKDGYDNPVADALDPRLNTLNTDTTTAAGLQDELKEVIEEAVTEVGKLAAAQKRYDEAEIAEADADGPEAQRAAQKELREANRALIEAKAEWELKKAEILAKLLDILERAGLLGGGTGDPLNNDDNWDDGDPSKPKSKNSPSDSPSDSPSSDKPSDSSSDNPSDSPGQTQLSSDTNPTQQQQQSYPSVTPQQQQQQQQPSMGTSPSAGMPQSSPSQSAFNSPRPRDKDRDRDKSGIDTDRDALPVATPVPAAVPIDRGTSGSGITTRDVSGKPSTGLSTSGQVPGAVNGQNPRGGVGGGMVGAPPPIGGGNKSDTSSKRGSKNFDLDRLMTRRDDDDQSVNSGALSKDSLSAQEKAREAEEDRLRKAMRDSVKRMMDKKAG